MGMFSYEKNILGVALYGALFYMWKNMQYYRIITWVILLESTSMDMKRVASIWKIMMKPRDITTEDISDVFLALVIGVPNIMCFEAQKIAHDHRSM